MKAFEKLKKLSLVASLILIPSLSFSVDNIDYADGFDYPMQHASDYEVEGLGYNKKYSGYYTDSTNNKNFNATDKEPDICEEVNDSTCIKPLGTWKNVSDVGNYYSTETGLHPAEDWNLLDGNDAGKEIHAIANGKVVMVKTVFLNNDTEGYQIIIKHTVEEGNSFKYPSSDPSKEGFTYDDIGNTVYSVYLHVTNTDQTYGTIQKPTIELNDIVKKGDSIGRIANTSLPHLHLEVRDGTKWNETKSLYLNAIQNSGYYESFENMKKDGVLDPSDFIQANLKITLAEPIEDIGAITSIIHGNATYGLNEELKLTPSKESQTITLKGSNFSSDSIIWWRANNATTFTALSPDKRTVLDDGKTLKIKFNDGKNINDTEVDVWEFIITNERGIKERATRSDFSNITKSNTIKFQVLPYSDSSSENKLPFTDVTIDDWYYPYVKDLFDKEAIIDSSKQFNPNEEISRSDFITMIILALVSEENLETVNNQDCLTFQDVSTKDQFHKYLNYAVCKEIINGNNTNFNPNDKIIRAEASKIIVESIERILEEELLVANTSFTDVPDSEWFSPYVKKLELKEVDNIFILTGYGDGTFQPAENINKAEASKIISLSSKIKDN